MVIQIKYKIILASLSLSLLVGLNAYSQAKPEKIYKVLASYFTNSKIAKNLSLNTASYKGFLYDFGTILTDTFLGRHLRSASIDTFFSHDDYVLLRQRSSQIVDYKLDESLLKKYKISYVGALQEKKEYESPSGSVDKATVPLFTANGKKAVLYVENFCGQSCGSGTVYLFEATEKGNWQIVTSVLVWTD